MEEKAWGQSISIYLYIQLSFYLSIRIYIYFNPFIYARRLSINQSSFRYKTLKVNKIRDSKDDFYYTLYMPDSKNVFNSALLTFIKNLEIRIAGFLKVKKASRTTYNFLKMTTLRLNLNYSTQISFKNVQGVPRNITVCQQF